MGHDDKVRNMYLKMLYISIGLNKSCQYRVCKQIVNVDNNFQYYLDAVSVKLDIVFEYLLLKKKKKIL